MLAGETYELSLDLPWQEPVVVTLPTLPLDGVQSPADGAALDVSSGLTFAWSGGPTDADEDVYITVPGAFHALHVGFRDGSAFGGEGGGVRGSEDGLHIPFEALEHWFGMVAQCLTIADCRESPSAPETLTFPVEVEVRVWRSLRLAEVPGFAPASSFAEVAFEMTRLSLTIEDAGGLISPPEQ